MLTPAFEISQDGATITIIIKAPFAKISDAEIYIEGFEFKFYSKPYYLRLNLPGEIVENGCESAKYDSDKGHFIVTVPKATPGEHFDGLDMLTRLLAPTGKGSAKGAIIEVLDSTEAVSGGAHVDEEEEEDIDWQIEQEPYQESPLTINDPTYGFASQRSGVFKRLQSELHDVISLRDADNVPAAARRQLRIEHEDAHFQDEHYLADLYEDEAIKEVLAFCPHWVDEYNRVHEGASPEDVVEIRDELREKLLKLPRKEYKSAQKEALIGLVDLIFAYAYNQRTTEGENNVESSWVITQLSTMLCWLETPVSVKSAAIASMRRSLCYPIYRNWKLAKRLLKDVQRIFITGRRCILKCLLEIHSLLLDTDSRYILNDLYITDYCVWIQSVSSKHIKSLAKTLTEVKIIKEDVGFELVVLEEAASLAVDESKHSEQNVSSDLTTAMDSMSLRPTSNESRDSNSNSAKLCDQKKCENQAESGSNSTSPASSSESEDSDDCEESEESETDSESCCTETDRDKIGGSSVSKSIGSDRCPSISNDVTGQDDIITQSNAPKRVLIEDITQQSGS